MSVCCFNILIEIRHIRYFFFIFCLAITSYELERPALRMRRLWCRLTLDNPFSVPCLCKLNHISVCFIQISTKITCKYLIPYHSLQGKPCFYEVIPGVLGRSVNFNITYRFLLRRPVFPDYPFLMNMITSSKRIWQRGRVKHICAQRNLV